MTEEIQVKIEEIDDTSPHLQAVIALGDANKKTLSFFPKGAFRKYAARRQIIVALDTQSACIGYLLYGYSRSYDRITLIHLCISKLHRGKRVAKKLVDYLIQITNKYSGIGLTCRRDYQLDNMWANLGFVSQYDKPAKTPGKGLTYWWLDHGHSNLFSTAATHIRESKLCVVIDNNIFTDLYTNENIDTEESKSLLADWLQPDLELCLTDAIFNKINTIGNDTERKNQRQFAQYFNRLICQNQKVDTSFQESKIFFAEKGIILDEFELRNIAITIVSDVQIFITLNRYILDVVDEIYDRFRVSILRPNDLISQLDELSRKPEYQPVRLAGTFLEQTGVQIGQESLLNDCFQSTKHGETKVEFKQRLRRFIAEKDKFECYVVKEAENQPLALVVYGRHKQHELEIPLIRVGQNHLSATLARHLIFQSISRSAREQRQFTRITDPYLEETVTTAMQEDFFIKANNGWLRANLAVAETASQLSLRLSNLASNLGKEYKCHEFANILSIDSSTIDSKILADIERYLWPAKIIDANIPTFIIPIKPHWAKDLFDDQLANQYLFGSKTELALNREAVYYCSGSNLRGLKAPGRILWYVSKDKDSYKNKGYYNVSSVRACSRLDEVIIGKPQELFRRFRRLGVYEWENVFESAENDMNKNIIAIRFSDSEVFAEPIPLKKLQQILGNRTTVQSLFKINPEKFANIYTLGTQLDEV